MNILLLLSIILLLVVVLLQTREAKTLNKKLENEQKRSEYFIERTLHWMKEAGATE